MLLSFCNSNSIQHNPLPFKRSVTLCHPEPLREQTPCGPSELDLGRSPSSEGPRETEPIHQPPFVWVTCSLSHPSRTTCESKSVSLSIDFLLRGVYVCSYQLILGSLEEGLCISYHILLPNKHVCTRYPAAFLIGNLALQDPLLLLS